MFAPRPSHAPRTLVRLVVLALLLAPVGAGLAPAGLRAQACGAEVEPNNTEADAQPQTGLFCVAGTLPQADGQDLYLWEIDDETADTPIVLSVTGVPGTVTTAAVFAINSEPGVKPVVAGNRLFEVTSTPEDTGPVSSETLIPEGRYLLGISRTTRPDGGLPPTEAYTLEAGAGAALPDDEEEEPNDDPTTAMPVAGAFKLAGDLEGSVDTFAWTLSDDDAERGWEITARGPIGLSGEMTLIDGEGTTLTIARADPLGRMTLYDLALEAGDYLLRMGGDTSKPHRYALAATAIDRPETDLEPNNEAATADETDFAAGVVKGRLTPGDQDVYRLPVDDTLSGTLFDIRVIRRSEATITACIIGPDGQDLQCKSGPGAATLADIALPGGDYLVELSGEPELDVPYVLRIDATSAPAADFETEPNDAVLVATEFEPSITMRGSFAGSEDDYFRIPVTGDPQLWSVVVEGAGVDGLSLQDANGRELAATDVPFDSGSAELTDLYLPPGDHWVRVRGADGDYTVRAVPLGPPDPNGEREANNDVVHGEPLLVGQVRTGRVVQPADRDYFRFSLAARDHVVVGLTAPADASMLVQVSGPTGELARWDSAAAGEAFRYDAMLEPGDYVVVVGASQPSTERYALTVERADPFDLADDQEPNGTTTTARPLPADREIRGDVSSQGDVDWYALPAVAAEELELVIEGDNVRLELTDGVTTYALEVDDTGERYTSTETLPADAPLYVAVVGTSTYRLSLGGGDDDGGSIFDVPTADDLPQDHALPVSASLAMPVAEVAAYLTVGQRVDGELTLTNDGEEALSLDLDAVTSHYAWTVELGMRTVELTAGETVTVPVGVVILADAWANVPVRVTVAATDADGSLASAFAEITPTAESPAVGPMPSWQIPEPLLGGLDVAATSLGATIVAATHPDDEAQLHDGVTPDGLGYVVEPPFPLTTTVDLAGDEPLPIAGFVVNPQAGDTSSSPPRGVELLLSTDGSTFTSAWSGELSPLPIDQAIVLDAPVEAAYARLVVTSAHSVDALDPRSLAIGEWKVIAQPGVTPESYLGANIASEALGGHVVLLDPQGSDDPNFPPSMLDEDPTRMSMRVETGTRPSFVLGFQHDRAAMISELQWVDPDGSLPETRIVEVLVEVSLGSPVGPWEPIGTWALERAGDGSIAPFVLDEARWARFLRFTGDPVTVEYDATEFPATLRVIEAAAADGYRSILGEWGQHRPEGIYELLNPPDVTVVTDEPDAPDSPSEAAPLTAGEAVSGRANIGSDVDWYAVTIPDGQNTLTFDVTGVPVVDVTVEVFDAAQSPVTATLVEGETPGSVQYVAEVEAGATYTVRVAQPQHSIVFAFDTSGSIGPYYDAVFQALRSYTADVEEGQEFVNIIAFDEDPLLDGWTDDPYSLSTAVSRYRLEEGSSSAETGVLDSTELLAGQDGTKAILLITDAETSSYANADEMWGQLERVGPRIFAVHIGAVSIHTQAQDWMQDWAISGDGFYQYTRTQAEMDRAFDRAATWLRRPAAYGISYATSQTSTEPGSLRVVSPPVDEAAGEEAVSTISDAVTVEIIFDTSGSMLATMPDGQRRVDAARTVLVDLVTNKIPAGVPVALRVFGNTPGSCETSLAVPLAPLDPAAMGAVIAGIEPVNEVKTPIGASLDQVANDLAGVEGPKIVILVTDGEETCDGDAAAAIERLAAEGVDVQVNIVGFALDDEALKTTFRRWARLGNGTYFDATNAEELDEAIAKAVQAPFRVYDAEGELVASGTVDGGSVRLPAGTYRVVVLTDPETVYEAVVVGSEDKVKLTLGEQPPE